MSCYPSKPSHKTILNVLDRVIEAHQIPGNLYSLDGYAEDRVCLEKKDGKWLVYTGTRGRMCEKEAYNSVMDACNRMIEKITDDYEEEKDVKLSLSEEIQNHLLSQGFDAVDVGGDVIPKIV